MGAVAEDPWEGWEGYDTTYFDPFEATLEVYGEGPLRPAYDSVMCGVDSVIVTSWGASRSIEDFVEFTTYYWYPPTSGKSARCELWIGATYRSAGGAVIGTSSTQLSYDRHKGAMPYQPTYHRHTKNHVWGRKWTQDHGLSGWATATYHYKVKAVILNSDGTIYTSATKTSSESGTVTPQ